MAMKNEIKLSRSTFAILGVLLFAESKRATAAQIVTMVEREYHTTLSASTVFKGINELMEAGCIEAKWEDTPITGRGRPRKRIFSITGDGASMFEYERNRYQVFAQTPTPEGAC